MIASLFDLKNNYSLILYLFYSLHNFSVFNNIMFEVGFCGAGIGGRRANSSPVCLTAPTFRLSNRYLGTCTIFPVERSAPASCGTISRAIHDQHASKVSCIFYAGEKARCVPLSLAVAQRRPRVRSLRDMGKSCPVFGDIPAERISWHSSTSTTAKNHVLV